MVAGDATALPCHARIYWKMCLRVNNVTPKYTPILPRLLLVTPSHAQGCSLQEILFKLEISLEEFESLPAPEADAKSMSEAKWLGGHVWLQPQRNMSISRQIWFVIYRSLDDGVNYVTLQSSQLGLVLRRRAIEG